MGVELVSRLNQSRTNADLPGFHSPPRGVDSVPAPCNVQGFAMCKGRHAETKEDESHQPDRQCGQHPAVPATPGMHIARGVRGGRV
jgi:hypothetical protein